MPVMNIGEMRVVVRERLVLAPNSTAVSDADHPLHGFSLRLLRPAGI